MRALSNQWSFLSGGHITPVGGHRQRPSRAPERRCEVAEEARSRRQAKAVVQQADTRPRRSAGEQGQDRGRGRPVALSEEERGPQAAMTVSPPPCGATSVRSGGREAFRGAR
jgi:hypothetical protein